jgi:hypothetical protein
MIVALIETGSVNLTRWLPYIPCRGKFAQSKQRRQERWLHNARINIHRLYKPLIQAALIDWQEDCIHLSLDTSLFWDEYCLVRLAVVHRGRALPVIWRVMEHDSAAVSICRLSGDAATGSGTVAEGGEGNCPGRPRLCPYELDEIVSNAKELALSNPGQKRLLDLASWQGVVPAQRLPLQARPSHLPA